VTGSALALSGQANNNFQDNNEYHIEQIMTSLKTGDIGAVIADIDGTLGKLTPGNHVLSAPIEAAGPMTIMAQFFPTGVLTGRPHKVVETGFGNLLDQKFGFAGTEAGARLVKQFGEIVYERKIPFKETLQAEFQKAVSEFPHAFIEEHTMCSIIVGLTKVDSILHKRAFDRLEEIRTALHSEENPIHFVKGEKTGINVHYNIVCEGVHKGVGTREIFNLFQIKKPALAFGDDKADLPMFEYVKARGGITVGVGLQAPPSDIRFSEPEEAVDLMHRMALQLQ